MVKETSLGAEAHSETSLFTKKEESGTVRLIRTASKCLARGADDKSGCYLDFKTFMNSKDEEEKKKKKSSSLLVPFRGNRFNILFCNAEIVFYLAQYIEEFFGKINRPSNTLQKAVSYDIKEPLYLAMTKALGLCSKLVTAPFWRILEQKDCSLQDTNEAYQKLYSFLEKAKDDCTEIVCGTNVPFDNIKKDDIYRRLIKPDPYDGQTSAVLQQIFSSWHSLLTKAASDHLPGGSFADINKPLEMETKAVPRHNKFPERVFALLDALTRFRPVASTLCNESYIMFSLNKTGDWLNSLTSEKREKFLDMSRAEGRDIRAKYIARIKEIEKTRQETLKARREQTEKKEHQQFLHREELLNKILFYGLWQYPEAVDQHLKQIHTNSEKIKALKTQIQFRKIILEQKHQDKKVFQFSEKGKAYEITKLRENVKILINSALCMGTDSSQNIFVGKKIIHYMIDKGSRLPYRGRVISTVPGYPNWYNVVYDDDDAVYVYKLDEDYASGDLEIIIDGINNVAWIALFRLYFNCMCL